MQFTRTVCVRYRSLCRLITCLVAFTGYLGLRLRLRFTTVLVTGLRVLHWMRLRTPGWLLRCRTPLRALPHAFTLRFTHTRTTRFATVTCHVHRFCVYHYIRWLHLLLPPAFGSVIYWFIVPGFGCILLHRGCHRTVTTFGCRYVPRFTFYVAVLRTAICLPPYHTTQYTCRFFVGFCWLRSPGSRLPAVALRYVAVYVYAVPLYRITTVQRSTPRFGSVGFTTAVHHMPLLYAHTAHCGWMRCTHYTVVQYLWLLRTLPAVARLVHSSPFTFTHIPRLHTRVRSGCLAAVTFTGLRPVNYVTAHVPF